MSSEEEIRQDTEELEQLKKHEEKERRDLMQNAIRRENAIIGELGSYFLETHLEKEVSTISLADIKKRIDLCEGLKGNKRLEHIIAVIEGYESGTLRMKPEDILLDILENESS